MTIEPRSKVWFILALVWQRMLYDTKEFVWNCIRRVQYEWSEGMLS